MRRRIIKKKADHPFKSFLTGLAGGVAGTMAMAAYFKGISLLTGENPLEQEKPKSQQNEQPSISVVGKQYQEGEPSTAATGRILYEKATGRPPENKEKKKELSNAVHWTYGTLLGGLYSAIASKINVPEVPASLAYGTGMWLIGSELAVPMLGLGKGPDAYPVQHHAHSLVGHWIYGLTVSCVRKVLSS
jgi:hypothetical protein